MACPVILADPVNVYTGDPANGSTAVLIAGSYGVPSNADAVFIRVSCQASNGQPGRWVLVLYRSSGPDQGLGCTTQSNQYISETGPVKLNNGYVYIYNPQAQGDIHVVLDLQGYTV